MANGISPEELKTKWGLNCFIMMNDCQEGRQINVSVPVQRWATRR
jgi:hypothetical protein